MKANPLSCAAALAVQKVIADDKLLDNIRTQGAYLGQLLRERLQGPNALAAPVTFDVRGGGGFWGIEFDTDGKPFKFASPMAMLVQERCLENGLVIMGLTGGSNLEGTKGSHAILAPAYNVTKEEVEKIVDIFVKSVETVLKEAAT